MFALTALTVLLAVGAGIDLGRAYLARQQLSAVADLTCQYANRPSIVQMAFGSTATGGGSANYVASVDTYYAEAFASQNVSWSQTTATPFSYTMGGTGTVAVSATIPTTLMYLIGIATIPISASAQCFSTPGSGSQPVPDAGTNLLVFEGFENTAYPSSLTWYTPSQNIEAYADGQFVNPVVNSPPTTVGYIGLSGTEWLIMGYCLEIDDVGKNLSTVPQGTHSAELDCDNGSGTAGNSSISTRVYLTPRTYELRWFYASRIPNTYYGTSYICGTTASDTSWANDTSYTAYNLTFGARTNQINAYLDQDTTGAPPTHTTLDGSQTLGGSNMIDECVYSSGWIERSITITVTTGAYYWLSFAADGANDSFGGQIDDIRLCVTTCAGTVQDNYPPTWLTTNNSVLFEETFASPSYANMGTTNSQYYYNDGNVGLSYGSSQFWGETGYGWGDAPTNRMSYWVTGCEQGQCIQLGSNSTGDSNVNNLISKPFLLDPGYYQISYNYASEVVFGTASSAAYCGTTPAGAGLPVTDSSTGTYRQISGHGPSGNVVHDTNAVGVFMSHAQLASTPNPSTSLGATTYYTNPDGTSTTTPTVPPNAISLSSYSVSTVSPLLDICGYATSWQARTRNVLILKPAFYWLTFAALGTADGIGGEIDDVKITALGSPYMTTQPSSPVTIPVPDLQPGSTLSFTGFSIITGGEY